MRAYLDWNATAPLRPEARDAWAAAQEQYPANPSSRHQAGQAALLAWEQGLRRIAAALGCRPHEILVTGSGSEALATAIHGLTDPAAAGGILASRIDHSAVLRNAEARAVQAAFERTGEPVAWHIVELNDSLDLVMTGAVNSDPGTDEFDTLDFLAQLGIVERP